ncbi:MAG: DUF2157 domain-containing protein [Hyphomicrobiaceae bacterium]|nr:DUF2157 domain-containing protein [Hyphomicrobiaceae bacterium]
MWIARRQFGDDLARWQAAGWVTEEGSRRIQAEIDGRGRGPGFAGVLAILGAVLLGFALMSFVAANWQEMSRLVRLGIIFAGLFGSYAAAGVLFARQYDAFGHAAVLAGLSAFGAGIMLIAQIYHIDGHLPDAVFTWALGALATGLVSGSPPALAAAAVLLGLWTAWETGIAHTAHYAFLPILAALALTFHLQRWRPGLHLTGALATGWVVKLGYVLDGGHAHGIVAAIGLAACAVAVGWMVLARRAGRAGRGEFEIRAQQALAWAGGEDIAASVLGYAIATAFAGLFALQFLEKTQTGVLVGLAALTLLALVAAIIFGLVGGRRGIVWLGYVGFSVEILAVYFKTVGTLLGSSVFFLIAGLIVIALAGLAWRLHRAEDGLRGGVA